MALAAEACVKERMHVPRAEDTEKHIQYALEHIGLLSDPPSDV